MIVEHEFTTAARTIRARRRGQIWKLVGAILLGFFSCYFMTAADRATAARYRAAFGESFDRELDAAARQAGLDVLAFLRDVRATSPTENGPNWSRPALIILKELVKGLASMPSENRQNALKGVLFIASRWNESSLLDAVLKFAELPASIRDRILDDQAFVLRRLVEEVKKQSDLATAIDQILEETKQLRCEENVGGEIMKSCGRRRGREYLRTR